MYLHTLLRSFRLPFLLLPPVCVFLALSWVLQQGGEFSLLLSLLILLAALLAHISVNALNEFEDFHSGLDLRTQRTPFSGGSGALPEHPAASPQVLFAAITALLLTVLIGLYFISLQGWELMLLGLPGLLLIVCYTRWLNRSPWLCLVAPGAGFGLLMVSGSHWVMHGEWNSQVLWLAAVPFFLVNNLLLLNQYPDCEADKSIGRRHFPIAYGIAASNRVYALFLLAAVACLILSVVLANLPALTLIGLAAAPLGLIALYGAQQHGEALGQQPQFMAANVGITLLMPTLMGLGILFG